MLSAFGAHEGMQHAASRKVRKDPLAFDLVRARIRFSNLKMLMRALSRLTVTYMITSRILVSHSRLTSFAPHASDPILSSLVYAVI